MTTRTRPTDYGKLAAQFAAVRRSWKRAAALSGLAIVLTEGLGLFTAMLFLDWLYQPQPVIRIAMWAVVLGVIVYFIARHVIKPLFRKISDEQIALFIEEHRSDLDGVLITAAEFSRKRDDLTPSQAALIDTVVRDAAARSAKSCVSGVADLSRLKKYGLLALGGIVLYVVLGTAFPGFSHRLGRLLQPWKATDEDVARHEAAVLKATPLKITLSQTDTSLQRGTTFEFDATLNKAKPQDSAVELHFRPKSGGGDWQKLAMTEVEKLNTFHGTLPDVSEDLEFYVSCGEVKSDTYKLTVYDPLIVQSMEMTVHLPDYIKQPDRVEKPSTGDVTALIGSKATLRLNTSTALKSGQIKFANGQTQPVTVDPQTPSSATVTFELKEDTTYDYTLTDVNGQQAVSAAPLSVHVIPDTPPTVNVKSPVSPTVVTPLGEVNFVAEAGDDYGVVSVELVYSRVDTQGSKETRVPLKMTPAQSKDSPNGVEATYSLALEDMQPVPKPNDTIAYHVEAKDAKGQVASSPIGFIIVGYFESWATFAQPEEENAMVHDDTQADLMAILALAWELDNQKTQISADELKKRASDIAAKMVDGQGALVDLINAKKNPKLLAATPVINDHLKKAHDALAAGDSTKGLSELTIAAAILAGNGVLEDQQLKQENPSSEAVAGSHYTPPSQTLLEQTRMMAQADANADKTKTENDKSDAEAAAAASKAVDDLLNKQDALIAKAQAMVNRDQAGEKGDGKQGGGGGGGAKPADLAKDQHDLADKTRAAANAAKGAAKAGGGKVDKAADKTNEAAKLMDEAARALAAGKTAEGAAKAADAKAKLQEANDGLHSSDRDKLSAAISDAQRKASLLLDKQNSLNTDTDAAAKDLGTNKPDQRQQRDLQKLAVRQTELGTEAEALGDTITTLNDWAAKVGQPDAVRALSDAQKAYKRNQPQTKMANAVVDINTGSPSTAVDDQKQAAAAMQKIVDALQAGSDSLAANREAQLARAQHAAEEAKKSIEAITGQKLPAPAQGADAAGKAPGTQTGKADGKAPGTQDGKTDGKAAGTQPGKADGKAPGTEAGKADGKAPGAEAGKADGKTAGTEAGKAGGKAPGTEAGKADGKAPGTEAGKEAGTQPGTQNGNAGGGGGSVDDIRKLAYNLAQLSSAVDNRQLVAQDQADQLKQLTMDKAELEKKLATDPQLMKDVAQLVANISGRIEAEIESKAQASKLFSSQREECPPNYRQFVNKYFQALSEGAPKASTTPAPGQP